MSSPPNKIPLIPALLSNALVKTCESALNLANVLCMGTDNLEKLIQSCLSPPAFDDPRITSRSGRGRFIFLNAVVLS